MALASRTALVMLLCVDGLKYTGTNLARIWAALRMCVGVGARLGCGKGKESRGINREESGHVLGDERHELLHGVIQDLREREQNPKR